MSSSYLLHVLMVKGCAEWSLVLLLFLLKTKQLVNMAVARKDLWIRMVHDFEKSDQFPFTPVVTRRTPVINLLDTLYDEVIEQRKNEEQVFSSTNSVL